MGVRIEAIVGVMIAIMLIVSYLFEAQQQKLSKVTLEKEMETYNSVITEADRNKTLRILHSEYAMRSQNVITLRKLAYRDDSVKRLTADDGKLSGDLLYLDHRVNMLDIRQNRFLTEHGIYNKKTEIFKAPENFTAYLATGEINGTGLVYDQKNQTINAGKNQSLFDM